jgi:hypothetical protein
MVFHLGKKKPPGLRRWRFRGFGGWSLAGPFRQQAKEIEEPKEEPAHHERH